MRAFSFLYLILLGILTNTLNINSATASPASPASRHALVSRTDNGKTTDVTWDKYSLSVKGERVFVFSGEFHYHRLPVPELWLDVFQKLRANGFNAVSSIDFHGYSQILDANYSPSLFLLEFSQRLRG